MHQILNIDDIERMKFATVSSPPLTKECQIRQQLKEDGAKRVSKWNNTLAAQHALRLEWKARKEEEKERRRQDIDKEEAKLREQLRLKTIQRAQTLLNEQRDKVKILRSQQMYQDVLETRKVQMNNVKSVKNRIEKEENIFHEIAIAKVKKAEEEELETTRRRKTQAKQLSREMKESMDKLKRAVQTRNEQQKKDEAEEIRKLGIEDSAVRQKTYSDRLNATNQAKLDYYKLTQAMKDEKHAAIKKEEEENEQREREVLKMLGNSQARILLERKHFEKREAQKKYFYNKASQSLEQGLVMEAERLQKDVADIEHKQTVKDGNLEKATKEMNDAIHKSRRQQIEEKARLRAEDSAKGKMYIEQILKIDLEEKERLNLDAQLRQEANKKLLQIQEQQSMECKRKRDKEKAEELEWQFSKRSADEDEEFCHFAALEIERLTSVGKKTELIERALRNVAAGCAHKTPINIVNLEEKS